MGVHVDETGSDGLPASVDRVVRLALRTVANDGDPPLGERQVGDVRRGAASIVDADLPENCV
jgi:hypothetical protein